MFPSYNFEMEKGVIYEWKGEDYLFEDPKGSNRYCLPFEIINSRVMLGAVFMKNHDILFDKNKKEIHFVRANCTPSAETVKKLESVHLF